ncbi:MAG: CRISPR system precrRNA processing endoribonuclease RAMP protein Cas6 [Fastidiosipilaceae bacterium]|jgi:CRISPR-associated endoribonuclease Cas6|nr:CRISPR system precrRNA processing endoribonuclease RAMP protein Cas6 [Clostridiaceae bacterium]
MLSRITLTLDEQDGKSLNFKQGSTFHGYLFQQLSAFDISSIHKAQIKPFTQWVRKVGENNIWSIQTVTQEMFELIDAAILKKRETIFLEHSGQRFNIKDVETESLSLDDFISHFVNNKQPRKVYVNFLTPTSFRSNDMYQFYPTIRWLFVGLLQKFDLFSKTFTLGDSLSIADIEDHVVIDNYRLNSTRFPLEKMWIPSFIGTLTLWINGPQPLVNIINLLLHFAEYSGIGIKTALGMGAVKIYKE